MPGSRIQDELFSSRSARDKYASLVVGRTGLGALLQYEFVVALAQARAGALGLVLRKQLYPWLLGGCGRNVVFGQNVVLRHPHKIHIGSNVVIDDNCLLDAKGESNQGIRDRRRRVRRAQQYPACKDGDLDIELKMARDIGLRLRRCFPPASVTIGAGVLMAAYAYVIGGDHDFSDPPGPCWTSRARLRRDHWRRRVAGRGRQGAGRGDDRQPRGDRRRRRRPGNRAGPGRGCGRACAGCLVQNHHVALCAIPPLCDLRVLCGCFCSLLPTRGPVGFDGRPRRRYLESSRRRRWASRHRPIACERGARAGTHRASGRDPRLRFRPHVRDVSQQLVGGASPSRPGDFTSVSQATRSATLPTSAGSTTRCGNTTICGRPSRLRSRPGHE